MNFTTQDTTIDAVKIVNPKPFNDDRGWFMEVFNANSFKELGINAKYVQMNHSSSEKGVLRGLHFQWEPLMGKLMRVTRGKAFLVAVDIRKGSPTYGKWVGGIFSEDNKKQLWAPGGFARGFYSLEDRTEIQYLITGTYNPENESEIAWNDPDLKIHWPINDTAIVSEKDQKARSFKNWTESTESNNFQYAE